jgi:hypothetical protein
MKSEYIKITKFLQLFGKISHFINEFLIEKWIMQENRSNFLGFRRVLR